MNAARTCLGLALLLALPLSARGQQAPVGDAPAAAEAPAPSPLPGATVSTELRAEYVQGVPMVVPVTIANPGAGSVTVPDLAARPWLVRFDLVLPDGRQLRRSTTAPETDPGRTVTLPQRAKRRTLLEVPGAEASAVGPYELVVQLVQGDTVAEVGRRSVTVATPRAVSVDLGPPAVAGSKVGLQAVWLHQASDGYDLYLHQASSASPIEVEAQRHLAHLPAEVRPLLAAARSADASSPLVAWATGPRALHLLRVDPTGQVLLDQGVETPWPAVELAGRPALLAGGGALVPLWVPAPAGAGGELRLLSLDSRGRPGFPRIARFDARPQRVQATVDAAGAAHFLVQHGGTLDLYSVRPGAPQGPEALPVGGRRLHSAGDGGELAWADFAVLPDTPELPGGLSLLTLQQAQGGLVGRWVDLRGNKLLDLPLAATPPGAQVLGVAPAGAGAPGVLYAVGGKLGWAEGGRIEALGTAGAEVAVVRAGDGGAVLRLGSRANPVVARRLTSGG